MIFITISKLKLPKEFIMSQKKPYGNLYVTVQCPI